MKRFLLLFFLFLFMATSQRLKAQYNIFNIDADNLQLTCASLLNDFNTVVIQEKTFLADGVDNMAFSKQLKNVFEIKDSAGYKKRNAG